MFLVPKFKREIEILPCPKL